MKSRRVHEDSSITSPEFAQSKLMKVVGNVEMIWKNPMTARTSNYLEVIKDVPRSPKSASAYHISEVIEELEDSKMIQ